MVFKNMRPNLLGFLVLLGLWAAGPATGQVNQDPNDHTGHNHGPGVTHGPAENYPKRTFEYSSEVLDAWARLAIQEGGRIKPLDTMAGFKLLRYNGKRGIQTTGFAPEDKLTPIGWMLDCIFFPEQASEYPCFVVDLKDVTVALGLNVVGKEKRDHYSYNEILTVRSALMIKAQEASRKDSKQRSTVERQMLTLSRNFLELEDLLRVANFGGYKLPAQAVPALSGMFSGSDPELPQWLSQSAEIKVRVAQSTNQGTIDPSWKSLIGTLEQLRHRNYGGLAMFPPTSDSESNPEWYAWPDLIEACLAGDPDAMANLPALEALGSAFSARMDGSTFSTEAIRIAGLLHARAQDRGEYARIGMEVDFYRFDFFYRALYFFLLGFLLTAFSWLRGNGGGSSAMTKSAWVMNLGGLA
ncbi:MAG: hypothetical protein P1V35_11810, partial [Planctomycetota bacterium]|nr:hypothetical protein [Planctomycetota bacterium]